MTVDDHAALFAAGRRPTAAQLDGVWRMDTISNANQAGGIAYLQFSNKPDGRFEARYELMGLMEGLVTPTFLKDHFQLNDFTPFHDEIRRVIGRFPGGQVHDAAAARAGGAGGQPVAGPVPRGGGRAVRLLLHADADDRKRSCPRTRCCSPFLDVQLPDGVGMTFDEEMEGWYFAGMAEPAAGTRRRSDDRRADPARAIRRAASRACSMAA